MSLWEKFKPKTDRSPEAFDRQLDDRLHQLTFQPRPEFEQELKHRLLNSLAAPPPEPFPAPALPGINPVGLGLGAVGLAAVVILVISVLSVYGPGANPALTPVAKIPVTTAQAGTAVAGGPEQHLLLVDAASEQKIKQPEAERELGFAVRTLVAPPAGYKLEYSAFQSPTGKLDPGLTLDVKGYQLRYSAGPGKNQNFIEVSGWQVPFTLKTGPAAQPSTADGSTPGSGSGSGYRYNSFSVVVGAQSFSQQPVQGQPGYYIQGGRWRIQLFNAPPEEPDLKGPAPAGKLPDASTNPKAIPPGARPAPASRKLASPVSFGRLMPNRPDYYIEYSENYRKPDQNHKGIKSLIWQQNGTLYLVSVGDELSLAELTRLAEGIAASSGR